MAIDTTALELAYTTLIDDNLEAGSVPYELAKIALANFLAALHVQNGALADNVQSWTVANKTFTYREMKSLRDPSTYQQELDGWLGTSLSNSGGYYVSMR